MTRGVGAQLCGKVATHGRPAPGRSAVKVACKEHATAGMINVTQRFCLHPGCAKKGGYLTFRWPGDRQNTHCAVHAEEGMVGRKHPLFCKVDGCLVIASFGAREYCAAHRDRSTMTYGNKTCLAAGCDKGPIYGPPDTTELLSCAAHKQQPDWTLNAGVPRCQGGGGAEEKCGVVASYIEPGADRPTACAAHKTSTMRHRIACSAPGCTQASSYGLPDGPPTRCHVHAVSGALLPPSWSLVTSDVVWSCARARAPQCAPCTHVRASVALRGAPAGMVNRKHAQCPCGVLAKFGALGASPTRCRQCAAEGMLSPSTLLCAHCTQPARYGTGRPDRCPTHRQADDFDFCLTRCARRAAPPSVHVRHSRTPLCVAGARRAWRFCRRHRSTPRPVASAKRAVAPRPSPSS